MAQTQMLTGNSLTVKLWEKQAWVQAMARTCLGHVFNRGGVYFPEKLMGKNTVPGDNITFPYIGKLTNIPIGEGGTADGNEEALSLQNFTMAINVSRIPVLNPNTDTIEQQRTVVEFETNTRKVLAKRAAELLDTSMFYQLAGAAPTSLTINGTTYSRPRWSASFPNGSASRLEVSTRFGEETISVLLLWPRSKFRNDWFRAGTSSRRPPRARYV
jgi:hypothetical protein